MALVRGIEIDYSRDSLITPFGLATLKDRYLIPRETSPQEAFARAATAYADDLEHAQRLYDYASKLWFMFSTPVLSNGGTEKGLGVSCYLNYVPDSRKGLTEHYTENAFLSSLGGGIGGYWGHVRSDGSSTSKGSVSSGSIPFIKVVDSEIMAFHQGGSRRGSYVICQDIGHSESEECINIRKPTGGDINRKALNLHNAINLPDAFMEAVDKGKQWDLRDPHSGNVTKTVSAREMWQLILETRVSTGEPYMLWVDTVNRFSSLSHQELNLKIYQSNLCHEIVQPTNDERTAVCCLSSVNLELYDEWKYNELFIEDLIRMLDNVISDFVSKAPPELNKAAFSASMERSLGLGAMGFHFYLQKNNIPFESPIAKGINLKQFELVKTRALAASEKLAEEKGAAPDITAAGVEKPRRNVYLIAIAPNASSSIICGETSPSIEPCRANAFTHKTMSGSFLVKNKFLEQRLEQYSRNDEDTWKSIITNAGSVQHLDFLTDWEKDVFKTALEIDQHWIIQHAADRQPFICQSQSLNLFFPANTNIKYLHSVHMMAWKSGVKSLYYCRSESISRPDLISKQIERVQRNDYEECISCSG
jgi:ribonucleoside-diphosphate reductase alpha chain